MKAMADHGNPQMEDTESVESIHALLSVETGARDAVTGNRRTATKLKAVIAASTALAAATILTVVARGARRGGDSLAMEDQGALSRKFSNQFDCDDGFNDWRSAWSDDKKHWCCHNEGRGCQFDVVSHDVPYSSVRPNHGSYIILYHIVLYYDIVSYCIILYYLVICCCIIFS